MLTAAEAMAELLRRAALAIAKASISNLARKSAKF